MQVLENVDEYVVLPLYEPFSELPAGQLGQDLPERRDDIVHRRALAWFVLNHGGDERLHEVKVRVFLRSIEHHEFGRG